MTTPQEPQDPFSTPQAPLPPQAQSPQQPPAYAPPPHIVVSQSSGPTKLALWATILTGAVTVLALIGAFTAADAVDELKSVLADPDGASPFAGQNPLDLLSAPLWIASFVVLALWMSRVRSAMVGRGEVPGGPPAVEWWGWFVPLANFVLPYLGMRAITRRKAGLGIVLGWWLTFCLYWVLSYASIIPSMTAVDYSTGELTHPENLDAIVPLTWAGAITLAVSWVFLALVIRQTTAAEDAIATNNTYGAGSTL
ncbi:DUF4328 domain-containing protein [Demequina sp. TTPB684]|uniref:DUF4328 domain-containing protein n=1 Tax=unclassified Demequina TaxID=2620311 RepID=UPI001CF1DC88|nr:MULTISPECIES: DUF4328 domain-containing protein [unclassified Demequina]MCB2412102.1 DUF4328 domain-containing protein [Demequina sp. TTPB684]UPU88527.1 DUF4328 domain-containing protein [Demequina sp. TMPB413]